MYTVYCTTLERRLANDLTVHVFHFAIILLRMFRIKILKNESNEYFHFQFKTLFYQRYSFNWRYFFVEPIQCIGSTKKKIKKRAFAFDKRVQMNTSGLPCAPDNRFRRKDENKKQMKRRRFTSSATLIHNICISLPLPSTPYPWNFQLKT